MKVLEDVGRGTQSFLEYAGGAASLTGEAASFIARLRVRVNETFAQAYLLGVQSTPIVLLTSLFTGMVISLESANQAKTYGVTTLVGGAVTYVSARELGPMLTAVVVAGRAGAAIAAELGSMVVTEQIEALEALGLSPVRMLVVPRLVAMFCMLPLLTILADIVSILGGMLLAKSIAGITYGSFLDSARQFNHFDDFGKGLLKSLVFAVIIVTIGCYQGFRVRGGAAGVGKSTTGAVVTSIILIFLTNFLMSLVLFGSSSGTVTQQAIPPAPKPHDEVYARVEDVTLKFGEKVVLANCSLDVREGAITCLIGLSGAGKSTILRLLNGLRMPDAGRVTVEGTDLRTLKKRDLIDFRRQIGFAFQFAALFDSLTIAENIALPLQEHTKLSKSEIDKKVLETLDSVGLADSRERMPSELSGGMLKRAGFARAIVTSPRMVLYDEPTTGLDPIITHLLTDTIKRLRQRLGGTAVVISHDLGSIYEMADYVAMLFEGAIIAYGTVDEIKRSPNPIVQQFIQGSEVGPIPL